MNKPDPIEHEIHLDELHDFEDFIPMTKPERDRLRRWVYSGHSVDTNPWKYTDEMGYELNYIDALHENRKRIWGDMYRPFYLVIPNP